jgi:hypothetical protein
VIVLYKRSHARCLSRWRSIWRGQKTDNAVAPTAIRTVELSAPTSLLPSIYSEGGPDDLPMPATGAASP